MTWEARRDRLTGSCDSCGVSEWWMWDGIRHGTVHVVWLLGAGVAERVGEEGRWERRAEEGGMSAFYCSS